MLVRPLIVYEHNIDILIAIESPAIINAPDARIAYGQAFKWNLTTALSVIENGIKRQTELKAWHGDL